VLEGEESEDRPGLYFSRAVESDMVCASTEAAEDGVAFLFRGVSDVGLIATDRAEVRWGEVISLKPEVRDLGFLVTAVSKCDHG
jgi:hypothetical protein